MTNKHKINKCMRLISTAISVFLILIMIANMSMTYASGNASVEMVRETDGPMPTPPTPLPTNGPIPCSEYVADHPDMYPNSVCQQIVSTWRNSITNDENVHITVNVGTNVEFSFTSNSDIKHSIVDIDPKDIVPYNVYSVTPTLLADIKFDRVGYYYVNLEGSNSFARGGVTWYVTVVNPVVTPPVITPIITPIKEDKFKVGPTIRLRPLNDVMRIGQPGIVEIYMDNPSINDVVLNVDLTISFPLGINIQGEGFREDGLVDTGQFTLSPGDKKTITIVITAENTERSGNFDFTVKFSGTYWPGNNKGVGQPISLTHPFTFKMLEPYLSTTVTGSATPIPIETIPVITTIPMVIQTSTVTKTNRCTDNYFSFGKCIGEGIIDTILGIIEGIMYAIYK